MICHHSSTASDRSDAHARELKRDLESIQREQHRLRWRAKIIERALLETLPLVKNQLPAELSSTSKSTGQEGRVLAELDHYVLFVDESRQRRLIVRGWAWSFDAAIVAVELFIDGSRGRRLDYGYERPDVQRFFDGPPEMRFSGFMALVDLPSDYDIGKPLVLNVCDELGAWKRFEIKPRCRPGIGSFWQSLGSRWKSWTSTACARQSERRKQSRLLAEVKRHVTKLDARQQFSFVLAVDDQQRAALCQLYDSLRAQIHPHWELILVPLHERARRGLAEWAGWKSDSRVQCCDCGDGSRADRLNAAMRLAEGAFIGLLDGHERLLPEALAWLALAAKQSNSAWLYTDSATVDAAGDIVATSYKPDFSDLHLQSAFFTKGLSLYRRDELLAVGGARSVAEHAEEYELALRLSRRLGPERIHHLPELLVHLDTPADVEPEAKRAGRLAAVQATFRDMGFQASVQSHANAHGVQQIQFTPRSNPKVAVVIATRNNARLLRHCLTSLRSATAYQNFEIIVINNQSTEFELFDLLEENGGQPGFSCVDYDRPFNHSAMHNEVLFEVDADLAVLVNNDVKDFSPGWLEQLVGVMEFDDRIACVSPLLLYPDGRVQHAGIVIDGDLTNEHVYLNSAINSSGYDGRLHCLQDVSACSAACLLVRVSAFRDVGGFDADRYPVAFNDVDLCIRWRQSGYRCVYQPSVQAIHLECASRDVLSSNSAVLNRIRKQMEISGFRDPYFNPHLVLRNGQPQQRWTAAEARQRQLTRLVERLKALTNESLRHAA